MSAQTHQTEIWHRLAAARFGLDLPRAFEQWVYADSELERVVGSDHYFALISLDYGAKDAQQEMTKAIDAAYATHRPTLLRRDATTWIIHHFLANELDLVTTSRMLARFWNAGESWIPSEFAYIDSELDEIPMPDHYHQWEPAALQAKLAEEGPRVQHMQRVAVKVAYQLAAILDHRAPAF